MLVTYTKEYKHICLEKCCLIDSFNSFYKMKTLLSRISWIYLHLTLIGPKVEWKGDTAVLQTEWGVPS